MVKFWAEDPCVLFTDVKLFPTAEMSLDEKLNAITRLTLIVGGGLYYVKYEHWFVVIVLGLLLVLIIKYSKSKGEKYGMGGGEDSVKTESDGGGEPKSTPVEIPGGESNESVRTTNVEHFTIVPTYPSVDMHETTLQPIFSEEWQVYPPVYDLYTNTPPDVTFAEPLTPQSYPYGQYLTTTNLLPSDEQATRLLNGGPRQARSYIADSFTRRTLAFREDMTRLYKLKQARRFRMNNTNDTFSPYSSY
jgi:hypothetical protein